MKSMIIVLFAALLAAGAQAQSEATQRPIAERITEAAATGRQILEFDGENFFGPAWETLVAEGRRAQFFLLGEEHGIAENPKLAGELFAALAPAGYSRFMIEVSPPMAKALDAAARGGIDGLRKMFATPGSEPAFYGMAEEAAMLAPVRAVVNGTAPVQWGADYEVGGDPAPPKDDYLQGLEAILEAAHADAFTLLDLRPLRPLLGRWREETHPELMRVVHGFDALLLLSGSAPSSNLRDGL